MNNVIKRMSKLEYKEFIKYPTFEGLKRFTAETNKTLVKSGDILNIRIIKKPKEFFNTIMHLYENNDYNTELSCAIPVIEDKLETSIIRYIIEMVQDGYKVVYEEITE